MCLPRCQGHPQTGLVVTTTDSLRTSFTSMPSGWSGKTTDYQLGFHLGGHSHVRKKAGSISTLKVDVIIIKEAAPSPLRSLSTILAATYAIQHVFESSGMSISRDNVDRKVVLEKAFTTCIDVFAPKQNNTAVSKDRWRWTTASCTFWLQETTAMRSRLEPLRDVAGSVQHPTAPDLHIFMG